VVIPDWGALISLLPIAIIVFALVVFGVLFRRLLSAPKARRGFQPIKPATPDDIHMPGPSFSPIFAAAGRSCCSSAWSSGARSSSWEPSRSR